MDRMHIKRLLTICLALMLSVSMLPAGAFAAGDPARDGAVMTETGNSDSTDVADKGEKDNSESGQPNAPDNVSGESKTDNDQNGQSDQTNNASQNGTLDGNDTAVNSGGQEGAKSDNDADAPVQENGIDAASDGEVPDAEEAAKAPNDATGTKLTATITSGSNTATLDEAGSETLKMGFSATATLNVTAEFGAGADKTVEIAIPVGMTFHIDTTGNVVYRVNGLDETLKRQINPPQQDVDSKKNVKVLGIDQANGTITLLFHSTGEANDVKRATFSVQLATAFRDKLDGGLWDSGTAWFYDRVDDAVVVTQSIDGSVANEIKLGVADITWNESKRADENWAPNYNQEVLVDGSTTGDEYFRLQNTNGNPTYPKSTAYKYYSVTYLVPEGTVFDGFKTGSGRGTYKGASYKTTVAGRTTPDGYEVPAGKKALTWTIRDQVLNGTDTTVYPVWTFPESDFHHGDTAKIEVVDWKIRYYGRDYEEGQYEPVPEKLPSISYDITSEYEEVFVNSAYQLSDSTIAQNGGKRVINGYESDRSYNLYMGAPGFEHTQEREGGYFIIGNRGPGDSVEKTITIDYDVNNTRAIGITQQEIPAFDTDRFTVSNVKYKLWNSKTNEISPDWIAYTGNSNVINLKDLGTKISDGIFIKGLQFDISTIPAQQYLKNGKATVPNNDPVNYKYYCVVLSEEDNTTYPQGLDVPIKSVMTIANKSGEYKPAPPEDPDNKPIYIDTETCEVNGRAFNGLQGKSKIVGNCDNSYASLNDGNYQTTIQVGKDGKTAKLGLFHYAWASVNAQYVDEIYLISPFGEEYSNFKMDYRALYPHHQCPKKYQSSIDSPQPVVSEIAPTAEILAKYPKAKLYKLDFTGITDPQQMYDSRMIGGNVLTEKSRNNTPLSANSRTGMTLYFDIAPLDISDPTGTYTDLFWVKWNTDTNVPIEFCEESAYSHNFKDSFNLLGGKDELLGHLTHSLKLTPTEGLEVDSSIKQKNEEDTWYRTYDGTYPSIVGIYSDANYKLSIVNQSSLPVNGLSVYWPVPKVGENWGEVMCPEGAFNYTINLSNALRDVPEGYEVYYAKNITPSGQYAEWDNYNWVSQEDTSDWGRSDWDAVNFVKMKWVGTEDTPTINYGEDSEAVFDLSIDTSITTAEQMNTLDVWQPYFLRDYTNSSSWVAGSPVAALLTPGKLSGVVWQEHNAEDGMRDADEPVLSNVKVELYDVSRRAPVLRVVTYTDENGMYVFDGIKDGTAESDNYETCRIVVYNPTDPADESDKNRFKRFTVKTDLTDMKFNPAEDQKTAELTTDTRPDNREKNQKLDCGLVRTTDFDFTKLGENDNGTSEALEGAKFSLYTDEACTEPAVKEDTPYVAASDGDGKVEFKDILAGTYYMKETALPTGTGNKYFANNTIYKVVVKYNENVKIECKVSDENTGDITGSQEEGFSIINRQKTSLDGTKIWRHDSTDGPTPITVNIIAEGATAASKTVEVIFEGEPGDDQVLATETADGWTFTVDGLNRFKDGAAVTYKIAEEALDGYLTYLEGNTITNIKKTEATVRKEWNDGGNTGKRPSGLKFSLYQSVNGGRETEVKDSDNNDVTVTLPVSSKWEATVTDLPKYDYDGNEITYSWKEPETIENYRQTDKTVNGTVTTFTNTLLTEVSVKKVWDDADDQDGIRPEELKVTLSNGTEDLAEETLNEDNEWSATVKDLPKYDSSKEAIEYTWTESGLPEGYELTDTTVEGTVTTITNTHVPEEIIPPSCEVRISKVNEKGKAISGAVFEVYRVKDGSEVRLTQSDYRWLDANGRFTVGTEPYQLSGLEDGTYEIREVKAPEGYRIKDEWPVTFTVRDGKIDASLNTLTSGAQYEKIGADSHQYTITNSSIPGKGVKTGDETNIGLWLALLIAAAGCFAGAIVYRRRREE